MRTFPKFGILFLAIVGYLAGSAGAWSHKEHIQFTRLAAERLIADPAIAPAMKQWLRNSIPELMDEDGEREFFLHHSIGTHPDGYNGILHFITLPDIHSMNDVPDQRVAPFDAPERLMHYFDVELFLSGDQPRRYRPDLSSNPPLSAIPSDRTDPRFRQAGYLPLRIDDCYRKLVQALRDAPANRENHMVEGEEDSAVRWAAYLAHYLEDNTQPQHATMDYKSASYFGNPRKAPDTHGEFEYRMADDDNQQHLELRREYWPLFIKALHDPAEAITPSDDLFKATCEIALASYDALPLIGEAAVKARIAVNENQPDLIDTDVFFHHRGILHGKVVSVMEMKAIQTAWAVKRVEQIWKRAWGEAQLRLP